MLVEINLLPKKEQRNYTPIIISVVIALIVIALSIVLYFTYGGYKQEVAQLHGQIQTTKEIAGIVQSKNNAAERNNSVQQLNNYITWSEKERVKTVPLLVDLIGLLPERGYFMNFGYGTEGSIQLSVQFDTSKQAADYLNSLLASTWISDAKLSSLTTTTNPYEELEKNKEENKGQVIVQGSSNPYVPRYLGQYQITINKSKALELSNGSKASSKKGAE